MFCPPKKAQNPKSQLAIGFEILFLDSSDLLKLFAGGGCSHERLRAGIAQPGAENFQDDPNLSLPAPKGACVGERLFPQGTGNGFTLTEGGF